jgi:DNA-binding winged helix-turn-helix (wHTH) protein/tetratricopeptide (TPR) repeat protein
MPGPSPRERYTVGDLVLDAAQGTVTRGGEPLPLPPRTFELLLALARRAPERVRRHELLETVWPEEVVSDQTLSHRVLLLRRALGDDVEHPRYLASDRGWGYHLLVPVARLESPAPATPPTRTPALLRTPLQLLVAGVPMLAAAGLVLLLPSPAARARMPAPVVVAGIEAAPGDVAGEFVARRLGDRIAMMMAGEPLLQVARGDAPRGTRPRARIAGAILPAPAGSTLTLQLTEPISGRVLWDTTVTGSVYELFGAEERLTGEVLAATRRALGLPPDASARVATRAEVSQLCLRGEWLLRSWQGPSLRQAARMYERALSLDETSALAHAGLSITRTTLALLGEVGAREAAGPARAEALQALRFDPGLALSHAAQGLVRLVFDWDPGGAQAELTRALDAGPGEEIPLVAEAFYLQTVGQADASLLVLRTAADQDPYAAPVPYLVGRAHYLAGRPDAALEAYAQALQLDPYLAQVYLAQAHCHSALGRGRAALDALLQERRLSGAEAGTLAALERAHALGGLRGLWGRVCDDPASRDLDPVRTAAACARAGRREPALEWVRRGIAERATAVLAIAVDPAFDPLRDEELGRLLAQSGLPPSRVLFPGESRPLTAAR